ncbi:hypothetical protein MTR67_007810 [Solanum verrucosum]|uniref:Uncharacterized protein n=1 Tax=Solanum verrucosum TaxID=315347 RepID=A0AAF0TIK6_SOLVR|nr:hypothetical protein MTR67_007810 [Solanum verrucosum]
MWVMPRDTLEVLECWNKYSCQSEQKERWKIIPACIWWTVWKERNQRCFEDNHSSIQKLKMKCLALFYFWCKHEYMEDIESFIDVLGSLGSDAVTFAGEYDMVMMFFLLPGVTGKMHNDYLTRALMYYMAYDKAKGMLQKNRQVLEKIVEELLKYEVLTRKDLERIIADNDGVHEKEPFFLSKAYNEPVLENFLQENGKASSMEFLTAAN